MRKRGEHGVLILAAAFLLMFGLISADYFSIACRQSYADMAAEREVLTVRASDSQGTVYDRNMKPLCNTVERYEAVAVPRALNFEKTADYAVDREAFRTAFEKGVPFVFECRNDTPESDALTVFPVPERYTDGQPAQHIIGYISEGKGVAGIEYAYDTILRGNGGENSVGYSVDGFGRVIIGDGKKVTRSSVGASGVVTTIDREIQMICEECGREMNKGAIVVSDVSTGDILAMVSFPQYTAGSIAEALDDPDCPLIDRCLYSYGVGSIFKLVTACEAIEEGKGDIIYDCKGSINVNGQNFNCHRLDGHGAQNMSRAITNSCNTYFISLSQQLDTARFRKKAQELGFGRENDLCAGITGSTGVLPRAEELSVPAELANFSFGQGRLTATPLQINRFTCAIAGGGEMPELRLIRGLTADGKEISGEKSPQKVRVMEMRTARLLRQMMTAAVRGNSESNAVSGIVDCGAKTSTAQTGRYDAEGEELCHAWITGFFPAEAPEYAVTVLAEDGGYGNKAAAPVFRNIAERITKRVGTA
ncbi:MAG: penicillin-binding protein 2 [Ruminococcus sp.]|nr:penicillin-binding protein 2 [Ruminococcus sp.]